MSNRTIQEALAKHPIIAAVHSKQDAEIAAQSPCMVVFLLGGKLFEVKEMVDRLHEKGKLVFVHLDLAEGIAKDASGVQIVDEIVRPDGVITTKNNLVRVIREHGMLAALRCFIMDGQSYRKAVQVSGNVSPDFVEVMPGILPGNVIAEFCRETGIAVVAGGLVRSAVEANQAFAAGAQGISTSEHALWALPLGMGR
nr:glycerol-3-phosphate responsive antiterminator [uncultured Butyricicoccus sp.]